MRERLFWSGKARGLAVRLDKFVISLGAVFWLSALSLCSSASPSKEFVQNAENKWQQIALQAERNNFTELLKEKEDSHNTSVAQQFVNLRLADGSTSLLWAVFHDHLSAVKLLVTLGADANLRNRYGIGPLHLAALNGNADIARLLLQNGADPHHSIAGRETILMTASRTGSLAIVDALIAAGVDVNAKDRNGQTALMWGAAEGHSSVLNTLITAGADANAQTPEGFTALMFAARAGHADASKRLLALGADINRTTLVKNKNFHYAHKGASALIIAIQNGHFELASLLLEMSADPNDNRSGLSPLHYLVEERKPDIGDQSELPTQGKGEMTSLQFAETLIHHGANANVRIGEWPKPRGARVHLQGATPLFMAAKTADLAFIKLLVKHGADPLAQNINGVTPLMMAAGLGTQAADEEAGSEDESLAAIDFFIGKGADVNAVSVTGETAMHGAAYKNFPRVIHHLVSLGADIDIWHSKNKGGWTPIMIAQGFRPGNYKPSEKTERAFRQVMLAQGVQAPPAPSRTQKKVYLQ